MANGVKSILGIASPSTVFMQIGADLVMGLFNGISQTWNLITEFFTNAITSVITFVAEAWTSLTTATATAWNTIKTDVTTAFTMAKDTVLQAATNIRTKLTEVWNNATALTTSVWNFIKSHISTTFTAAKNKVVSVANALKSNLNAAWNTIKAAVTAAWNSIKSTTVSTWTSLSNTVSSKWQSLRTTIANVEWASIGRNLVEGLKNGVGGAWDSLVSKVQSLCNSLIARIKSWFGVASPSKVFAEIGGYLDAGLEQGIMDGEGKLLRTAENLAEAVTNGMTPNTPNAPNVEMTAEGVVTSMQAVQRGLSNVAATFKTIASTLSSMGSLPVPQIAAGTVVPYKVKTAASMAPDVDDSESSNDLLSGVLSELREHSRLLQLIETAVENGDSIKVLIDGREVFNTVIAENNRAIRRTGASPIRV